MPITPILTYLNTLHPVPSGLAELLGQPAAIQTHLLKKHECLVLQGARCGRAYFVRRGILKAAVPTARGGEHIYLFWEENEIALLEPSFFGGKPAKWQITALGPTELYSVSRRQVDAIYAHYPVMRKHTELVLRQKTEKRDKLIELLRQPKGERYALFQHLFPTLWKQLDNRTTCAYLEISEKTLIRSKSGR